MEWVLLVPTPLVVGAEERPQFDVEALDLQSRPAAVVPEEIMTQKAATGEQVAASLVCRAHA